MPNDLWFLQVTITNLSDSAISAGIASPRGARGLPGLREAGPGARRRDARGNGRVAEVRDRDLEKPKSVWHEKAKDTPKVSTN